jgi:hypothetical protein
VNDDAKPESKMDEFLKILSVCHTVVVEREQHGEEGVDHVAVVVTNAPSAASDVPVAKIEYQVGRGWTWLACMASSVVLKRC